MSVARRSATGRNTALAAGPLGGSYADRHCLRSQLVTSSPRDQLLRGVLQEVKLQRELKTLRVQQCVIISNDDC
jgi:hypothetical protein